MRIIAGEWKGRTLFAPKGEATRPTTDRVRESLMSTLASARGGFDDAVVLDAFAGSGALGLEALSRGARTAWFFDSDAQASAVIKRNIAALRIEEGRTRHSRADVLAHPPLSPSAPFDLLFLDPPYAFEPERIVGFVAQLEEAGALADDAIVCYEHDRTTDIIPFLESLLPSWQLVKHKECGKIAFDVFGKDLL